MQYSTYIYYVAKREPPTLQGCTATIIYNRSTALSTGPSAALSATLLSFHQQPFPRGGKRKRRKSTFAKGYVSTHAVGWPRVTKTSNSALFQNLKIKSCHIRLTCMHDQCSSLRAQIKFNTNLVFYYAYSRHPGMTNGQFTDRVRLIPPFLFLSLPFWLWIWPPPSPPTQSSVIDPPHHTWTRGRN